VKDKTGIHYDVNATIETDGFLGITYIDDNDYYGLFGDHYYLNEEQGRFWKDIYDAIIQFVKDSQDNVSNLNTIDFSDVAPWIPIEDWYVSNNNTHTYQNNNPNLKKVFGIYAPCDVDLPGNENAMRVSFESWSTAYPYYGKPYFDDKPVSIPTSFGHFPKGYPLCFSHEGNARAYVLFLSKESREYSKKQYCRIFNYPYQPNRP